MHVGHNYCTVLMVMLMKMVLARVQSWLRHLASLPRPRCTVQRSALNILAWIRHNFKLPSCCAVTSFTFPAPLCQKNLSDQLAPILSLFSLPSDHDSLAYLLQPHLAWGSGGWTAGTPHPSLKRRSATSTVSERVNSARKHQGGSLRPCGIWPLLTS